MVTMPLTSGSMVYVSRRCWAIICMISIKSARLKLSETMPAPETEGVGSNLRCGGAGAGDSAGAVPAWSAAAVSGCGRAGACRGIGGCGNGFGAGDAATGVNRPGTGDDCALIGASLVDSSKVGCAASTNEQPANSSKIKNGVETLIAIGPPAIMSFCPHRG